MKSKWNTRHINKPAPAFESSILAEPLILFGGKHEHVDPKTGLSLYGPYSLSGQARPSLTSITIGMVGPSSMLADAEQFLGLCKSRLTNDGKQPFLYPYFPGFNIQHPFQCDLIYGATWQQSIKKSDLDAALAKPEFTERVKAVVLLYIQQIEILNERDPKPNVVLCCIPQEVIDSCTVQKRRAAKSVKRPKISRLSKSPKAAVIPDVIETDIADEQDETEHQNLRRGIKADAMKFDIPTQLIWPRTISSTSDKSTQDIATRAWNLTTALYHKAGGTPWRLAEVEPGVCYVGISFFKEIFGGSRMRTSMAQAFTASGDGYVLRGQSFEWDEQKDGRSPHLDRASAKSLLSDVLELYKRQSKGSLPKRIVVHKTSRFHQEELEGLKSACEYVPQKDFVAIGSRGIQFYRLGSFPPVRGTYIKFSDTNFALYTTGYIPYLRTYPGSRVPQALEVLEHHGDSQWNTILSEILALTKMNWNTADFSCSEPVTLAFSKRVAQILAEVQDGAPIKYEYRFYM